VNIAQSDFGETLAVWPDDCDQEFGCDIKWAWSNTEGPTGPRLLIAVPFHGAGLVVQALPIDGSAVVVGRARLALTDVARLAGAAP
jgi:hypothetical protein